MEYVIPASLHLMKDHDFIAVYWIESHHLAQCKYIKHHWSQSYIKSSKFSMFLITASGYSMLNDVEWEISKHSAMLNHPTDFQCFELNSNKLKAVWNTIQYHHRAQCYYMKDRDFIAVMNRLPSLSSMLMYETSLISMLY